MLSVCIPHYNFVNPALFEILLLQCRDAKIEFEIIIADDASLVTNKTYLNNFTQKEFKIFFLDKNIGRSAIRNLLATKALYPYLLFLDADAEIIRKDFIAAYLNRLGDGIISGGRIYPSEQPDSNYFLHYKYGSQIEQYAKSQFQSNNFVVPKSVFSFLTFDENIKGYGFEDVLFGLGAKRFGLKLNTINNPVKHIKLKTNDEFLNDTEQALQNLQKLISRKRNSLLKEEVAVSAFYLKLEKYKLTSLLSIGQKTILKKTRNLLLLNIPFGVTLLITIYKLYYFHSLKNVKENNPAHLS